MCETREFKKSPKKSSLANDYSPGENVSVRDLKEAMTEALFEADFDTFKGCIAILLDKGDCREITKATGLSKSTLYRMSEPISNPRLKNIGKLLNYIDNLAKEETI